MKHLIPLVLGLLLAAPATAAEPLSLQALLAKVDDAGRSTSSSSTITMHVKTKRYERSVTMQNWTEGTERSLIRIVEPAKDRGVTMLKVDDNLWNFLPNTGRTMKVPGAMMSGAWMGSHLTNDDLVRETRFSDDYTCVLVAAQAAENVQIDCTPKPDAPVPWGKVSLTVLPDGVPVEQAFFDEDGELVRTLSFDDVQTVGTQRVAMTMTVTPHDKPGEFTKFVYEKLELDVPVDPGMFSLQALGK